MQPQRIFCGREMHSDDTSEMLANVEQFLKNASVLTYRHTLTTNSKNAIPPYMMRRVRYLPSEKAQALYKFSK